MTLGSAEAEAEAEAEGIRFRTSTSRLREPGRRSAPALRGVALRCVAPGHVAVAVAVNDNVYDNDNDYDNDNVS